MFENGLALLLSWLLDTSCKNNWGHSRSPALALLAEVFDNSHHLLAATIAIDHLTTHAHRHLLAGISAEKALDEEVAHQQANKDTTVATVLLLGAILEVDKSKRSSKDSGKLASCNVGLGVVGTTEGVVVESDTIEGRDKEQRPMATTLSDTHITIVVDG